MSGGRLEVVWWESAGVEMCWGQGSSVTQSFLAEEEGECVADSRTVKIERLEEGEEEV